MTERQCDHVKFRPWVGKNYQNRKAYGFRAMILGESHYDTGRESSDFTEFVVGCVVNGTDHDFRTRLFTKTARLFSLAAENRRGDRDECRAFWQNVLFYNFVQDYVGPSSRSDRPTQQMWEDSVEAFEEVVHMHRPDLVLVLGKELSRHLGKCPSRTDPRISFVEIAHPQSFGWKYGDSSPILKAAINRLKSD